MEKTENNRDYQVTSGTEKFDNKSVIVYGIVMTEYREGRVQTQQLSSISTSLKVVSELAEKLREGDVHMVHFKDVVYDFISEL